MKRDPEYDDPKPRGSLKKLKRSTAWSPRLLELVRKDVICEREQDFVTVDCIADFFSAEKFQVGNCVNQLVKEGLLSSRSRIHPIDDEGNFLTVTLRKSGKPYFDGFRWISRVTHIATWKDGVWVTDSYVDWDGFGYYILRDGDSYRKARKKEGLSPSPWDPWICQECKHPNSNGPKIYRRNCQKCNNAKESVRPEKETPAKPTCTRCGVVLKFKGMNGKKKVDHSLRRCNENIVQNILES